MSKTNHSSSSSDSRRRCRASSTASWTPRQDNALEKRDGGVNIGSEEVHDEPMTVCFELGDESKLRKDNVLLAEIIFKFRAGVGELAMSLSGLGLEQGSARVGFVFGGCVVGPSCQLRI